MNELLCSEGGGATRGSEFRLQAGQDRVNAELQTDPAFVRLPVARGYETLVDPDIAQALGSRRVWIHAGYVALWAAGRRILVHHVVAGYPLCGEVDHINGDRFDNRRCNLRVVDHSCNMLNQRRRKVGRSGFRGVDEAPAGYRPRFEWHGRFYRTLTFREAVLAALARDDLVRRVTGREDGLNFPGTMSRAQAGALLRASHDAPVTLWFVKRSDGSVRRMSCRAEPGVPLARRERDDALGLVTVRDVDTDSARCIPMEAVLCVTWSHQSFRVTDAPRAAA